MIYSMTGYASKTIQLSSFNVQLEIKSVNHRFLDITIKLADEFKAAENSLRTLISQKVSRGKLDVKIFLKENRNLAPQLNLNHEVLQEYLKIVKQISQISGKEAHLSANEMLHLPGVLAGQHAENDDLLAELSDITEKLIIEFNQSQLNEGNKLQVVLMQRLNEIEKISQSLQPLLKEVTKSYQQKIKQRLSDFLAEQEINEQRLQQEFAFFCQKMDVSEEIDRLIAHVSEFKTLLANGNQIGKRLDFICQEMHREANTFGSKSVSIETTRKAVELKVLIEQIREQVQNIM